MGVLIDAVMRKVAKVPKKQEIVLESAEETIVPIDYAELAKKAGFKGYEKVLERQTADNERLSKLAEFRQYLSENGITVYPLDKVKTYLERIKPESPDGWSINVIWKNLSGRDTIANHEIGGDSWTTYEGSSYDKPIPAPALMTAAKIKESYPQAEFYVSDFTRVPKGDPFLGVMFNKEFFVIERWDEPSFRM